MNRLKVQSGPFGSFRDHRHLRLFFVQLRIQSFLQQLCERPHMTNGTVSQKRHRAMSNPSVGFYLGPPGTTMSETNAVDIQRLRNDHMINPGF